MGHVLLIARVCAGIGCFCSCVSSHLPHAARRAPHHMYDHTHTHTHTHTHSRTHTLTHSHTHTHTQATHCQLIVVLDSLLFFNSLRARACVSVSVSVSVRAPACPCMYLSSGHSVSKKGWLYVSINHFSFYSFILGVEVRESVPWTHVNGVRVVKSLLSSQVKISTRTAEVRGASSRSDEKGESISE